MKKKFFSLIVLFTFGFLFFLPKLHQALAVCDAGCYYSHSCSPGHCNTCEWCLTPPGKEITNPALSERLQALTGIDFLNLFLPNLITIFFIAATVVALIISIVGGIKWMTAGDDKEGASKARKTVTAAVMGLIMVFAVYALLGLIGYFFGLDLISIDISPLILE